MQLLSGFILGGVATAVLFGQPRPDSPLERLFSGDSAGAGRQRHAGPVVLHYFDARGRGEALRLAFADNSIDFEERSFTAEEWGKGRSDGIKAKLGDQLLFGQVPMVEVDGLSLVQSHSILRYFSRKWGWYDGYDSATLARIDMLSDGTEDVRKQLTGIKYDASLSSEDKQAKYSAWCQDNAPLWLGFYEKALQANSAADLFVAGTKRPSAADYLLYDLVDTAISLVGAVPAEKMLGKLPELQKWHATMTARPRMQQYLSGPRRRNP